MLVVRTLVLVLLLAALGCFVAYLVTGRQRWRAIGIRLVRWTVLAGLGFFAVLIVERLVELQR